MQDALASTLPTIMSIQLGWRSPTVDHTMQIFFSQMDSLERAGWEGKDHASASYIFTRLEKIARAIFQPDDDPLLNYLNDDGCKFKLTTTISTHTMTLFDDQGPNSTSPLDFHDTDLTGLVYRLHWKK